MALVVFWQTKGSITSGFDVALRWFLLPFYLLVSTVTVAKNDYWGKGNWICVVGASITFMTVPYTEFVSEMGTDIATFTFRFPNFMYMVVGIIISVCGIGIGTFWKKKTLSL